MSWINEFNSVFFISISTLLVGALGVALKVCVKSRCEHVSFCFGAVKIDRRVDLEAQEEMKQIEMGTSGKQEEEKIDIKLPSLSPPKNNNI